MTRLTSAALLVAVLALLAPPAGAVDNNFFNWNTFRRFDYLETPTGSQWGLMYDKSIVGAETTARLLPRDSNPRWCGNLRYGPPGHQDKVLPYAELWLFAVGDTESGALPNRDTMDLVVEWRWKSWYPGDPSTIYYGPWRAPWRSITVPDSLYVAPLMGGDSLGWFYDVEFRAFGNAANDSSRLYLGVSRRIWK